jgi:CHAT domain-containing protein
MEAFYGHLAEGATFSAALRSAQLEVAGREWWLHPWFWAPWTLHGDPSGRLR